MLTDASGHLPAMMPSFSIPGYARLYRDGALVGDSAQPARGAFLVPAESGDYRLEAFLACNTTYCAASNPTAYSSWTFRSAHTDGVAALPLIAVRYLPALDEFNRAAAGVPFAFPVEVETETGKTKTSTTSLTVEASYDDGGTWQAVRLRRVGNGWQAIVDNPDSGYVSLRATARDAKGNAVTQTVLRAYGVTG
jgi:hypothetical protein